MQSIYDLKMLLFQMIVTIVICILRGRFYIEEKKRRSDCVWSLCTVSTCRVTDCCCFPYIGQILSDLSNAMCPLLHNAI